MEKLLIRDRLDEETMGSVNSPDIIVVPSLWDDVGELQTNYNARLEAAVTASKWGYLFVRVKNNSGETLRNIYVTASFSNDPSDGRNKRESLQTVDGMASSFIPELSPGEWVVTEQPFWKSWRYPM